MALQGPAHPFGWLHSTQQLHMSMYMLAAYHQATANVCAQHCFGSSTQGMHIAAGCTLWQLATKPRVTSIRQITLQSSN